VKGKFPIGFFIWNTAPSGFSLISAVADVYDRNNDLIGNKSFYVPPEKKLLMDWLKTLHDKENEPIAYLRTLGSDFQNNGGVFLTLSPSKADFEQKKICEVTRNNFVNISCYFAVRQSIEATWLNDRDQFLFPNEGWQNDFEFQSDCLIFTLFHGQNSISSESLDKSIAMNHWIPFTREQVGCKSTFKSNFMNKFLKEFIASHSLNLSNEAQAVYDAGLELWKYYHTQTGAKPNASFYDIRKHFQGINAKGHMNSSSEDSTYMDLISVLRTRQKVLASKIEQSVYKYGFLK
jgi:hypothetical protein